MIPSLLGFGLSDPTKEPWDVDRIANAWCALMTALGYQRFGVQGGGTGDIGASVSPAVARIAPDRSSRRSADIHTSRLDRRGYQGADLTDLERNRLDRIGAFMHQEYGYISIQSTRPQTLAYGLTDSPTGQLAWMVDKFKLWTWPPEALPEDILGLDRLLEHVSLYWFTASAGTSAYTGYATASWSEPLEPSGVPTGLIQFAHDIGIRRFVEREHHVTHWTDVDHGGHFAAMEQPEILVNDIQAFFGELR